MLKEQILKFQNLLIEERDFCYSSFTRSSERCAERGIFSTHPTGQSDTDLRSHWLLSIEICYFSFALMDLLRGFREIMKLEKEDN